MNILESFVKKCGVCMVLFAVTIRPNIAFTTTIDTESVGASIVEALTNWCPDAWCSGDFEHSWQGMTYQEHHHRWELEFVSFYRFGDQDTTTPAPLDAPFAGTIATQEIKALRSTCTFPTEDPLALVTYTQTADGAILVSGLSQRLRQELGDCLAVIEAQMRAK